MMPGPVSNGSTGPDLPFIDVTDAALQLHQIGYSCNMQHFTYGKSLNGLRCQ